MKPRWQFGLLGCWEGEAEEIAKLGKGEDNYFDDEIANMKFKRKNRLTFLFNRRTRQLFKDSPLNRSVSQANFRLLAGDIDTHPRIGTNAIKQLDFMEQIVSER